MSIRRIIVNGFFAVSALALPWFYAHAHGTGASFEKEINGYLIDVGYDPVILAAQEQQRFDFGVSKKGSTEAVDFTDIWVRIAPKERGIIFASGIHRPDFGLPGMTFTFPRAGEYELTVRFQKNGNVIAETSFPLTVETGEAGTPAASRMGTIVSLGIGIILGVGIGLFIARQKNRV